MRRTAFACLAVCSVLGAAVFAGQAPQPGPQAQPPLTFKVEVNYVEIDAGVRDADGNFVRGLTKDDFQLVEDGKPQTLTAFSMVDIPVEHVDPPLYAKNPIPPDVVSNRATFDGRVFVLVVDDLNNKFQNTGRARAAARQFVTQNVGANDLVAVVNTSGRTKAAQDFTSNRALLLKAIDTSMGNKAESSTISALNDYNMNQATGGTSTINASANELERYMNTRNTLRTLQNLADYLAGIHGRRKAVVFFSEGLNYNIVDPFNNPHATDVQREVQDLIAGATRANVQIYGVDPRGLATGMEDAIEVSSFASDNSIGPTDMVKEMQLEHDSLRVVSDETGGFAVLNSNDFRSGFSRILEDNSSYYVLGYYPTNDKRDGKFRNVQVKVLKPGLTVRARRGYIAPVAAAKKEPALKGNPAERTSPELHQALDSPVPVAGLNLTAYTGAFRGANGKDGITVSAEFDGGQLTFTQTPDGLSHDDLELSLFAADANGKIADGTRQVANMALRPQTRALVLKNGIRIVAHIDVPPGKYQLRVGAREAATGKLGMVIYDLDAPDFSKPPVAISGIALTSASASQVPSTSADPKAADFKDVLPGPPAAVRDFPRGDTLALFADVYDNIQKTAHRVDITASVIADDGKVVYTASDERKSEELQGAVGGYGYATKIPLTGIAPGRYVLHIEAKPTVGNSPAVSREIEFRVR